MSTRPLAFALVLASALFAAGCEEEEDEDEHEVEPPEVCSTEGSFVEEGPLMAPGGACISCHDGSQEGPAYTVAGTVMGAADDDTNCNGVSGVQVVLTGGDGVVVTLTTNEAGNFATTQAIAMPCQAKVVAGGQEKAMGSSVSEGDCNACHKAAGDSGAPGRITPP